MKPSTPLPWAVNRCGIYDGDGGLLSATGDDDTAPEDQLANAAYIVHACNAYPRLVEALRNGIEDSCPPLPKNHRALSDGPKWVVEARALLRELGEDK